MGKGVIVKAILNEEGKAVGKYEVTLKMDVLRARGALELLQTRYGLIDNEIKKLDGELADHEMEIKNAQKDINYMIWMMECMKYGYGDERMYVVSNPNLPEMAPTQIEREWKRIRKREMAPLDEKLKPKKEKEKEKNYSDDIIITVEMDDIAHNDRIRADDLYYDPETGCISRRSLGELILDNRRIIDIINPIDGGSIDDDNIFVITDDGTIEHRKSIVGIDVSDPNHMYVTDSLDDLPYIKGASRAKNHETGSSAIVYHTAEGRVYTVDASDPSNLFSFGPLPLPGQMAAIGMDADGNFILMAWDIETQTASMYSLDPFDMETTTSMWNKQILGMGKGFEQFLWNYNTGGERGTIVYAVASTQPGTGQQNAGLYTIDTTDREKPTSYGPFQEFASNVSYYYGVWESKYSEDTLYLLESTGSMIDDTKNFQEESRKDVDAARKWIQHWRLLILNVEDPRHPVIRSIIEDRHPELKQQPTSPVAVVETAENTLVLVGQTTEPTVS